MLHADDLVRTSWQCVHFEQAQDVTALVRSLLDRGIQVPVLDGLAMTTKGKLLEDIAEVLKFPEYFEPNWDALDECLRDLDWLQGAGCVLLVHNSETLWRQAPKSAGELVNSWLAAAEMWADEGVPFHLVFLL